MIISPSWCHMCSHQVEPPIHLFFHCSFAIVYWGTVLPAFVWPFTCPNSLSNAMASLLMGHPFGGTKKLVWLALMHAFFWSLRRERNRRLFHELFFLSSFYGIGCLLLFLGEKQCTLLLTLVYLFLSANDVLLCNHLLL